MTMLTKEQVVKQRALIKLLAEATEIILKYIKRFEAENSSENDLLVTNLYLGLSNLTGRVNLIIDNEQLLLERLSTPSIKRGGFGLSRGFGEFLWQGADWQNEIMDAVHKIERYYRDM